MTELIVIAVVSVVCIVSLAAEAAARDRRSADDRFRERMEWHRERDAWNAERQALLDRIQAPSYDHLKHHEVRVIKAQRDEKPAPTLDPL